MACCHSQRDLACVVHGDDFTFCGTNEDLDWIQSAMHEWFEIKVRGRLGPEECDDKELTVIGRIVRWRTWGIEYSADPRHREEVMKHFGFTAKSNSLNTTGKIEETDDSELEVEPDDATAFRAVAAGINYLAQDRPDIQFAAKEICRSMSSPTRSSWAALKRFEDLELHPGPDRTQQCGGRVLLDGRGGHRDYGHPDLRCRGWHGRHWRADRVAGRCQCGEVVRHVPGPWPPEAHRNPAPLVA